jgi:hypothetical protein
MKMTGHQAIGAAQIATWEALNDPTILKTCVPGCEQLTLLRITNVRPYGGARRPGERHVQG